MNLPNIVEEYRTIVSGAGWLDRSGAGRLRFQGRDVVPFLQALLSNDVSVLSERRGVYATYLTPQGRMIADLTLHRLNGHVLGLVPDGQAASLVEKFDALIFSEDVQVTDATSDFAELFVVGGHAAEAVAVAIGSSSADLAALQEPEQIASGTRLAVRSGDARLPNYRLLVPITEREEVTAELVRNGVRAMSASLAESLRIDAGRPRFGVDMTEQTIPLEAGLLERGISTSKGCYVGQEVVIRVLHRGGGRVARRLAMLEIDRPDPPPPGVGLSKDGRAVGHLTSTARGIHHANAIALGYVARDFAEPGQTFELESQPGVNATLTAVAT